MLRQFAVDSSKSYFDTNVDEHHHYYCEDDGTILDLPDVQFGAMDLPAVPDGYEVTSVDVIVRLRRSPSRRPMVRVTT